MRILGLGIAAIGILQAIAVSAAPTIERDWRDEVIYLIMPDRFHNGDRRNDRDTDPANPFAYHGCDLQGVIDKLDYIKDLGATTLWLTPVNDNQDNPLEGKYWGYHGYWIQDFDRVDEHFGDERTLKRLVDEAHARGMRVILDAVVNHAGYDAPMVKDPAYSDWFHKNPSITDWDDPYQNENFQLAGLPDFNSENVRVLTFMEKAWAGWIHRVGIDGFRLDTVRHVPIPFWHRFNHTMHQQAKNFFLVGEVSYHEARKLPPYLREGGLDSLFDFPMFGTMREVFARGKSMRLISERLRLDSQYPDPLMLSPFLDNHDEERFLSSAGGDERKLRLALAFLTTLRGIPSLYYGTEVGMEGGRDPDNRRDMTWGAKPELHAYTRRLLHLRQELAPLRRGTMHEWHADDQVFGFSRRFGKDEVLVFLNNSDAPQVRHVPVPRESVGLQGAELVNRLGSDRLKVGKTVSIALGPKEAKILVRKR